MKRNKGKQHRVRHDSRFGQRHKSIHTYSVMHAIIAGPFKTSRAEKRFEASPTYRTMQRRGLI